MDFFKEENEDTFLLLIGYFWLFLISDPQGGGKGAKRGWNELKNEKQGAYLFPSFVFILFCFLNLNHTSNNDSEARGKEPRQHFEAEIMRKKEKKRGLTVLALCQLLSIGMIQTS